MKEAVMLQKITLPAVMFGLCLFFGCASNPITGEDELMFFPDRQDITIDKQYVP